MPDRNMATRRLPVIALVSLPLLALIPLLARANPTALSTLAAGLNIIASDEREIILEWVLPDPSVLEIHSNGDSVCQITAPTLENETLIPGFPDLPALSRLIALPPGAHAELTVLEREVDLFRYDCTELPTIGVKPLDRRPRSGSEDSDSGTFFPAMSASLGEPGYFRDLRVVRLDLYPLRVDSKSSQLQVSRRIVVQVRFLDGDPGVGAVLGPWPSPMDQVVRATVLNKDRARTWRGLPADFGVAESGLEAGPPVYEIKVDRDGIYRVTRQDLLASGMDVTGTNPLSFALSSQGKPVAIEWIGDQDVHFEPGEGFAFLGQKFRGSVMEEKYTDVNVYWLDPNGPAGPRVGVVDGTPADAPIVSSYRATVHEEQDRKWNPIRTISLGDLDTWYWEKAALNPYMSPAILTRTKSIDLSDLAVGNYSATVRAALFAECKYYCLGQKHHAQLVFNGTLVDEQGQDGSWMNIEPRLLSGTLPQSHLVSGTNVLNWVLRGDVVGVSTWGVYLNWFEVDYQRGLVAQNDELAFDTDRLEPGRFQLTGFSTDTVAIWDVSYPLTPTRIVSPVVEEGNLYSITFQAAGDSFLALGVDRLRPPLSINRYVPPNLDPPDGADWIAITHADFMTEARRLGDYRRAQGLRVLVVDVEDLYRQFGSGLYQPAAIRDYLAHALTWPGPAPSYAVLVGDGNWNFKQVPGYTPGEVTYIPPFLGFLDPYQGEIPADNQYATLVGDDPIPDIALGRLPVRTQSEAALVVDKIMEHETRLIYPLEWQHTMTFLADNPDAGGDYHFQSDQVAALLPPFFNAYKIYYTPGSTLTIPGVVIDAFNAGATLFSYRGHGSLNYWAGGPALFSTGVIPQLTNRERPPVILTMDCLDTYFAYPGNPALSEALLRYEAGGSVAHWGSSGLGLSSDHTILHGSFFQRLLQDDINRLGLTVLASKLDFAAGGVEQHNLHAFTLMGDPAMPIMASDLTIKKRSSSTGPYYPGDDVTYTLTISNSGLYWGRDAVVTDRIPVELISTTVQWSGLEITTTAGAPLTLFPEPIAPYDQGVITITGRISPELDATAGLSLTNYAGINAPGEDWNPINNHASATIAVGQPAFSLDMEVPPFAASGGWLTFTLWLTNEGSVLAANGRLVDRIPAHTGFQSATGEHVFQKDWVTWTLPTLEVGRVISQQLVVEVEEGYFGAIVNGGYHAWADHAAVASGSDATTQVAPPPVASFFVSEDAPTYGQTVVFTSTSVAYGTMNLSWDLGDGYGSATGPTTTYSYTSEGPFVVTLIASDEYGASSSQIRIDPHQLALMKLAPVAIDMGDPLTYTLIVTNTGLDPVVQGELADLVPFHSIFAGATGSYVIHENLVVWALPPLPPGGSTSVELIVLPVARFGRIIENWHYGVWASSLDPFWGSTVQTELVVTDVSIMLPLVIGG